MNFKKERKGHWRENLKARAGREEEGEQMEAGADEQK